MILDTGVSSVWTFRLPSLLTASATAALGIQRAYENNSCSSPPSVRRGTLMDSDFRFGRYPTGVTVTEKPMEDLELTNLDQADPCSPILGRPADGVVSP